VLPGSGATSDKDALIAHTIDTRRKPQRTAGLSALQANPRRGLSAGTAKLSRADPCGAARRHSTATRAIGVANVVPRRAVGWARGAANGGRGVR
jgi:hypothetical protein